MAYFIKKTNMLCDVLRTIQYVLTSLFFDVCISIMMKYQRSNNELSTVVIDLFREMFGC
jgi:hypothetical protein